MPSQVHSTNLGQPTTATVKIYSFFPIEYIFSSIRITLAGEKGNRNEHWTSNIFINIYFIWTFCVVTNQRTKFPWIHELLFIYYEKKLRRKWKLNFIILLYAYIYYITWEWIAVIMVYGIFCMVWWSVKRHRNLYKVHYYILWLWHIKSVHCTYIYLDHQVLDAIN